ncbi:pinin/SDK/memA/ protein conserved region-domain-containing protein [Alternaria rosae]|uniref:pinin/SDK/memA/ protein conserved region-domain-containing protein n=1 Tax=Alternaria rosae TaxID=1187941 RepID=UPI001E8D351D|nr:pinin/SDK/memA/ protein conserved region-domain-containing protein [Alternaria rosae]KAH6878222.1 pinin/SDK/memA/ protein conserved region-domain-containing protein [Alternaria rosae]
MDGPIASAVVLPDDLALPASPPVNGHKRRQESLSEDAAKRPRLENDTATQDRRDSTTKDTKEDKPVPVRRERGRERRLFGAALGALSQNSATTAQKRRAEIEKRQLAQRKQDDQESEQRKAERAARRKEQRWKEHKLLERDQMRIRHNNLLAMAHFLQTKSEPHLYYKPWETSPDEEDRIRDQIAEAEETVKHEIEEYEARQQPNNLQRRHASEGAKGDAEGLETGKSHDADALQETTTTNGGTNGSAISPKDLDMKDHQPDTPDINITAERATEDTQNSNGASHGTVADPPIKEDDDENGEDVVEEAAEDTVIY